MLRKDFYVTCNVEEYEIFTSHVTQICSDIIYLNLPYFVCRTYGATAAVVFCYSFSCILLRNVPEKDMLGDEAVRRVSTALHVQTGRRWAAVAPEIKIK